MNSDAGLGDEVFDSDDSGKGKSNESKTSPFSSVTSNNKQNSLPKTIKFFALGLVSFTIPILYYLQANELKTKELKIAESIRSRDSFDSQLKSYYDTSLQYAKIKAYQTYSSQLTQLLSSRATNEGYSSDLQEIIDRLSKLSTDINDFSRNINSLRDETKNNISDLKALLTQDEFRKEVYSIKDSLRVIREIVRSLSIATNASSQSRDIINFVSGQVEQYGKRLSDLRAFMGSSQDNRSINRRRRIEDQLIIDKTQRTLDSLINGINSIYQRLPKF